MSSDRKSFFCATIKRNQKHCIVGYAIVQRGTDCAARHRLCGAAQIVQCGTDCAVWYRFNDVSKGYAVSVSSSLAHYNLSHNGRKFLIVTAIRISHCQNQNPPCSRDLLMSVFIMDNLNTLFE